MTNLEELKKMLLEINKEGPDLEELQTWFLGAIATNTAVILDFLEDMAHGNKL